MKPDIRLFALSQNPKARWGWHISRKTRMSTRLDQGIQFAASPAAMAGQVNGNPNDELLFFLRVFYSKTFSLPVYASFCRFANKSIQFDRFSALVYRLLPYTQKMCGRVQSCLTIRKAMGVPWPSTPGNLPFKMCVVGN
jgi:hypothetical protein